MPTTQVQEQGAALAWAMPLAVSAFLLHCDQPVGLEARAGANLMTSLRGLLLRQMVRSACEAAGRCAGKAPFACQRPGSCDAHWLLSPRSEYQRRDHAPPAVLHADLRDARTVALRVSIWGRRAIARQAAIWSAIGQAGAAGLIDGAARLRWSVQAGAVQQGPASDWTRMPVPSRLWAGVFGLAACNGGSFLQQLANMAHDMTQFALADAGLDAQLGKRGCDDWSDAVRRQLLDAVSPVSQTWHEAQINRLGTRVSRSNGRRFDLSGASGLIELNGDLHALAPWLALSTHWGLGGRKSFGMGRVRYFNDDGSDWPGRQNHMAREPEAQQGGMS